METTSKLRNLYTDTMVMMARCLRHSFRSLDTLITVIAMPVMIMFMFVYVLGGAINTGSDVYINFVVPGIVLMCIASGTAYTAFRINNDITKGIIDRFRSMPISKSALLSGHVMASILFNAISCLVVLFVAFLMGFRPEAGVLEWSMIVIILLLFTLALSWISVMFGLLAKTAEGASAFSYLILFMLFISSAFAPTESMPRFVRIFAENQPMTPIIEAVRSLMMNEAVGNNALAAVLWCTGFLLASYIISMIVYKNRSA